MTPHALYRRLLVQAPHLLLAVSALLVLFPALAAAHGGNPDYRSVINEVRPPVPGLELEVIDYDADIRLTAPAGVQIDIPGYEGEPYARILPDGSVQINQHSPSAYLNTDRYGNTEIPESADEQLAPEWETTRDDGIFQWHDHRSHWMSPEPPERLRGVTEKTKVFDYEIPIEVDGRAHTVAGSLYWVGTDSGPKLPFIVAGIAVLGLGLAAVILARRRRQGERTEAEESDAGDSGGW